VPIVLGGNTDAAVERAGRLADGWFPYTIPPADFARQAERLNAAARAAGRADAPAITVWPGSCDPAREREVPWVREYVDAGARTLVVRLPVVVAEQLAGVPDFVARYRDDVLTRL
jgi:alkanesulfonate monooxygenase SsuD/methylene tetrahydromethanopterin reductase-like flavin-dependent oxidoreductase (luciferase family)